MDQALAMASSIAAMNRNGVRMCLAHLDRYADKSRDTALRHAIALPRLFGIEVAIEGKAGAVLARSAARRDEGDAP